MKVEILNAGLTEAEGINPVLCSHLYDCEDD